MRCVNNTVGAAGRLMTSISTAAGLSVLAGRAIDLQQRWPLHRLGETRIAVLTDAVWVARASAASIVAIDAGHNRCGNDRPVVTFGQHRRDYKRGGFQP